MKNINSIKFCSFFDNRKNEKKNRMQKQQQQQHQLHFATIMTPPTEYDKKNQQKK